MSTLSRLALLAALVCGCSNHPLESCNDMACQSQVVLSIRRSDGLAKGSYAVVATSGKYEATLGCEPPCEVTVPFTPPTIDITIESQSALDTPLEKLHTTLTPTYTETGGCGQSCKSANGTIVFDAK